jgi:hypothetical protein
VRECNRGNAEIDRGTLAPLRSSEDAAALEDTIAALGGVDAAVEFIAATYRHRPEFKPKSVKLLLDVLRDVLPADHQARAARTAP